MISKTKSLERLLEILTPLRKEGKTIVFTNGCFDLLHVGHIRYLMAARALGDLLVLGLNSDDSVRAIKGTDRPLVPQCERAEILTALTCIDFLTIFEEPTPLELIRALQPDVLVKGADWEENQIVGADIVKANGGTVARIPLVPFTSTTRLIERIVARFGNKTMPS